MPEKDFAVASVSIPQVGGGAPKKPCYLVTLAATSSKSKAMKFFISLDKPELLTGFISAKGFYCDETEEDIVKSFVDILNGTPKESILDIMFPWHRVESIRSLVFNANKPTTLPK